MKTLKTYLLLAATAITMAACTAEPVQQGSVQPEAAAGHLPLGFSAYARRTTDTKAGLTGELDLTALQKGKAEGGGFGVFAYYSGKEPYGIEPQAPDFMYNQGVFYNGAEWEYSPVKYWPNGEGENVSFFAYAPYVAMDPATGEPASGSADWGITGMGAVREEGDPYIRYKAGFTVAESVDLCWAAPMKDCTRPGGVEDKVSLSFSHATALLDVRVDTYTDETEDPADPAAQTRIYIRSVTFEGIAAEGALNLNSTGKPHWLDYYGRKDIVGEALTLHDGRLDGAEGSEAAAEESLRGLNPDVVESTFWNEAAHTPGVTATERPLFANPAGACVIPTGGSFRLTLVYEVETRSANLATTLSDGITPGTTVRNSITKNINFGTETALSAGKRYTLKLHLGLSSVKFDAEVTDWGPGEGDQEFMFFDLFTYTGSVQTFEAPVSGNYKLEVWGAQGGDSSLGVGGKGAYAKGVTYLNAGGKLYVYVGQQGGDYDSPTQKTTYAWNGGGRAPDYNTLFRRGGGGTDIRTVRLAGDTDWGENTAGSLESLQSRIIVAGGGGGGMYYGTSSDAAYLHRDGGNGGTLKGEDGQKAGDSSTNVPTRYYYLTIATGGTQTGGGTRGGVTSESDAAGGGYGKDGDLGKGGDGPLGGDERFGTAVSGAAWGSGGGGGYYGGGGASWIHNIVGTGAGGSSYVGTLSNTQMIAGGQSMPKPMKNWDGTMETGHSGNGCARITLLGKTEEMP